jgi:hypothetical protein
MGLHRGIEPKILDEASHHNDHDSANETFTFSRTIERKRSKKWTHASQHTFGITHDVEYSGKILGIGLSTKWGLKYEYQNTNTEEDGKETSVSLTYSAATMLKPGQQVYCRATAMYGEYEGKYDATVSPTATQLR